MNELSQSDHGTASSFYGRSTSTTRTNSWQPGEVLPTSNSQRAAAIAEEVANEPLDYWSDDDRLFSDECHEQEHHQPVIWENVKSLLSSKLLVFRDHLSQLGDCICAVEDTVKCLEQQVTAFASDESLSSSSGSTSSTGGANLRKRKRRNPLSL